MDRASCGQPPDRATSFGFQITFTIALAVQHRRKFGIELPTHELPTRFWSAFSSSGLDQNAAHRFRCRREKVTSVVPTGNVLWPYQPQVRFVNQSHRLQCLAGRFMSLK